MNVFAYFKKLPAKLRDRVILTKENGIIWSVYALVFLFTLLLLIDGSLFYTTVFSGEEDLSPVPRIVDFSEKEINEMLGILNARQENFEKVFGAP